LYGIFGRHEISGCPLNNLEFGKRVVETASRDMSSILPKYKINNIVAQYHSGLEHTFLMVLNAEDPRLIEQLKLG